MCPPTRTKFCPWVVTPLPLEYVGASPVIVKPASAIAPPLLSARSRVYAASEAWESLSIWFEYEAADCQVEVVAAEVGHMPPKIYMLDSEALASTNVEKLNAPERKLAPGISTDVTSLVVVSFAHDPLLIVLVSVGEKLHSAALDGVEQDPAYTEISPSEDMEGMNAVELSLENGSSDVMVSMERLLWEMVVDMLMEAS